MSCNTKITIGSLGKKIGKLGSGSYGKVYLYRTKDGSELAVKVMDGYKSIEYGPDSSFLREATTLRRIKHPNVINAINITDDIENDKYYIALPVGLFDLRSLIDRSNYSSLYKYDAKDIARQIGEGLNYLANENIITGDLKPQNIVIFKEHNRYIPKLIDFGIATITSCSRERNVFETKYTLYYRPPEVIIGSYESNKSDAWVFGLLLYELNYKKILFIGDTPLEVLNMILSILGIPSEEEYPSLYYSDIIGNINIFSFNDYSSLFGEIPAQDPQSLLLHDLISKLLVINPENRFSIEQALNHPYFNFSTPQNRPCLDIIRSYKLPPPTLSPDILNIRNSMFRLIPSDLIPEVYIPLAIQLFDRVITCVSIYNTHTPEHIIAACVILSVNFYSQEQEVDIHDLTDIDDRLIPSLFSDILSLLDYNLLYSVYSDFINLYGSDLKSDIIKLANNIAFDLTLTEILDSEEIAIKALRLASESIS